MFTSKCNVDRSKYQIVNKNSLSVIIPSNVKINEQCTSSHSYIIIIVVIITVIIVITIISLGVIFRNRLPITLFKDEKKTLIINIQECNLDRYIRNINIDTTQLVSNICPFKLIRVMNDMIHLNHIDIC